MSRAGRSAVGAFYARDVSKSSELIYGSLADAVSAARRFGWVEWAGSVKQALGSFTSADAEVVPTRRNDGPIGTLRPTDPRDAKPSSLSAIYGLRSFPLHTDAAHLRQPPDVVLLEASPGAGTDCTPTLLWRPEELPTDVADAFDHGVFVVGRGRGAFQAHARCSTRLRYDPGCMRAQDGRARLLSEYLRAAHSDAHRHYWRMGTTLVLDNTRVLHGRDTVTARSGGRELRRLMLRGVGDASTV